MQVSTCMEESDPDLVHPARTAGDATRQRILEAAQRVFSRDGFQGATTREIAREAKVNEVTLFRHFRTRDELLRAAVLHGAISPEELLGPLSSWRRDLPAQLECYVRKYYTLLLEHEALVRAVVGEGRILPPAVRQAVVEKMAPMRKAVVDRLQAAQKSGCIRPDVNLACAVDILRDAVHTGMLRHTAYGTQNYSVDDYLRTLVELFIRGITKPSHFGSKCLKH
jgi:AcrR family transcriptional regulator